MNKKSVQVLIVIETVFIIQRCHNHPPSSIPLEQKSLCLLFDSCPKKVNRRIVENHVRRFCSEVLRIQEALLSTVQNTQEETHPPKNGEVKLRYTGVDFFN
jgi:hypothetical protein